MGGNQSQTSHDSEGLREVLETKKSVPQYVDDSNTDFELSDPSFLHMFFEKFLSANVGNTIEKSLHNFTKFIK